MSLFKVRITETYEKEVEVEANNGFDAVERVRNQYHNSEITLDEDDLVSCDFDVPGPLIRD